jgi:hypothetical protein
MKIRVKFTSRQVSHSTGFSLAISSTAWQPAQVTQGELVLRSISAILTELLIVLGLKRLPIPGPHRSSPERSCLQRLKF